MADLNVSVVMTLVLLAQLDITAYPRLQDWLTRCLERSAAADWKSVRFTIPRPPTALGILKMFL